MNTDNVLQIIFELVRAHNSNKSNRFVSIPKRILPDSSGNTWINLVWTDDEDYSTSINILIDKEGKISIQDKKNVSSSTLASELNKVLKRIPK